MNNTVTIEDVKANMQDVYCTTLKPFDKPVTFAEVRMKNGFTVRESTTCVDPANYNEEIGKADLPETHRRQDLAPARLCPAREDV